jgi:hypothetical protein
VAKLRDFAIPETIEYARKDNFENGLKRTGGNQCLRDGNFLSVRLQLEQLRFCAIQQMPSPLRPSHPLL